MAFLYNFYKEVELKTVVASYQKGIAAFTSASPFSIDPDETGTGWVSIGGSSDSEYMYWAQVAANTQGITITGAPLYDFAIPQTRPYNATLSPDNYFTSDTVTENGAAIYTAGFTADLGAAGGSRSGFCFRFSYEDNFYGSDDRFLFYPERLYYVQTPDEGTRTAWTYYDSSQSIKAKAFPVPIYKTDATSGKGKIIIASTTIGEKDYILIACGVDGSGNVNANTYLILLPRVSVSKFEGDLYIGETAEDDSETAFLPPDGGEWHDAITTRTNYDVNPYGVNQGGGLKVIFPTVSSGGTIYQLGLQYIINGIYRGQAEGILNSINQAIAEFTGGNANRPAEEVQAIISAILSLHSVPVIYPTGTAGSYASVETTFQTISGYEVTWLPLSVTSPGKKTIFEWVYTTDIISRRLNCFLDFEPFTILTLKLPFFPPLQLSPSAVLGHRLQVDYKIDIMTGLLSADVSTTDDGGTYYILSTLQGNVKTSIPIMGQGAQNATLEKITGAIVSTAKNGQAGAISGALSVGDELAKSAHGVAVGDMSVDGLGAYLSPRAAYLICTHPVAAIPASYDAQGALVGDFIDTVGMAANLGGKVGDFSGGFASFSAVDLSGVPCTDDEKREILRRLTEGVYL